MNKKQQDYFFQQLYEKYVDELKNYIRKVYMWDPEEAYDLLQDVFMLAYEKIDMLMKHENPLGWLKKTAKYRCWQRFEEKNKIDEFLADQKFRKLNERLEQEPDDFFLYDLQKALSEEEYRLLENYYMKGYSINELSQSMGISKDAVYSKMKRSREKARKLLFLLLMFG